MTTLGTEFRRGLSREVTLPDFPEAGVDVVLQWQEAQQNFVLTYVEPTQRLVDVTPTLTLPVGISIPNVEVTSLYSDTTAAVRASPEPTLLLAEDAGGTVLLGLANMDGGLLGEVSGEGEVSIASTAIVLVTLAAGYTIPDIDQTMMDQIRTHAQYPTLVASLTQRLAEDKNFLGRLFDYPDVVTLIRQVAGAQAAQQMYQMVSAQSGAVLPDGIRHDTFAQGSPWHPHAPWQWFGEAALATLSPPFLAQSVASSGTQASGNPNFVDYTLEVYRNGAYQDWYYIPGNGSLWEKRNNSYAAQRLLPLDPTIDTVRFNRYRLTGDSPRAALLSFVNTVKMMTSVVGVLGQVKAIEQWVDRLPLEDEPQALVSCAQKFVTAGTLPSASTGSPALRALTFLRDNAGGWVRTLGSCARGDFGKGKVSDLLALRKVLTEQLTDSLLKSSVKLTPVGWAFLLFNAANEVVPRFLSYTLPIAGGVEYHLAWAEGSIVCVSESQEEGRRLCPPAPLQPADRICYRRFHYAGLGRCRDRR